MYEFWCDYIKPKHGQKEKICFMDTNKNIIQIQIVNIKAENIYADTEKYSETKFDSSNYEVERPLPTRKN